MSGTLLAFLGFFLVLTSYYVLRPLRDAMVVAAGVGKLPWLFGATFGVTLVVVPLWSALVARVRRGTLLPLVYRFFIANLVVFYVLFRANAGRAGAAQAFFVWLSVFNLLAVAVFWSFLADLFRQEQARRLFGFVSAGGSVGAILGPLATSLLVSRVGIDVLFAISAVLLEAAAQAMRLLGRWDRRRREAGLAPADDGGGEAPVGGSALAGMKVVFRSPYLGGIAAYVLLLGIAATFGYGLQTQLLGAAKLGQVEATALYARLDLMSNVITTVLQAFVMGRVLTRVGVTAPLATLPPVYGIGFAVLAAVPTIGVSSALHVARRAVGFGVVAPASQVLFTVVDREQKYKAKAFIDTVIFRFGDFLGSAAFAAIAGTGLGMTGLGAAGVLLAGIWMAVAILVGRRYRRFDTPPR